MKIQKKKLATILLCLSIGFITGGTIIATTYNNAGEKTKEVSTDDPQDVKESNQKLKDARSAFETANKEYSSLTEKATVEEKQKAFIKLNDAYNNYVEAEVNARKYADNSSELKKLSEEKENYQKIVEEASNKLSDINKDNTDKITDKKIVPKTTTGSIVKPKERSSKENPRVSKKDSQKSKSENPKLNKPQNPSVDKIIVPTVEPDLKVNQDSVQVPLEGETSIQKSGDKPSNTEQNNSKTDDSENTEEGKSESTNSNMNVDQMSGLNMDGIN